MKVKLFDLRGNTFRERIVSLKENIATKMAMGILRPFNRHKMVRQDHIVENPENPIVFLGNHAEIYGPIASALNMPVNVRFWVISKMMFDKKVVRPYMYENTFSKKTFLPVFVRKFLAWYLGWLSVNVMNSLRAIAVYRDSPMKLRQTLRESVEALENGENLMIGESRRPLCKVRGQRVITRIPDAGGSLGEEERKETEDTADVREQGGKDLHLRR